MARRALIWHLYPIFLLVIVTSLLAVVGYSATSLRGFYIEQVSKDLQSRAALVQAQILPYLQEHNDEILQERCEVLGQSSSTRITVILPSGEVIGDSEEYPGAMDNHASRPEVQEAIGGRTGTSIRFSRTLKQQMMYVAVPIVDANAIIGVLRVALPITAIEEALWSIFLRIIYGTVVVALLAAVASWIVSRRITQPLGELRLGAEKFARGELDGQLRTHHSQEIDALADSMNSMAQELDDRMNTVIHQKQEQQAVLSSMVEGVLAVDEQRALISINETAALLFHLEADSSIGRNVTELIRNSAFHSFLEQTLHSSLPVEEEIIFHVGEERIYQAHGTVLQRLTGQGVGAVIVLHDVTRVRRLERLRSDFVSNVSHELRTPVTSIKGFVETLIETPPSDKEESNRFLKIISRNATQLITLIDDLLNLSRMEQADDTVEEALGESSILEIINQAKSICLPASERQGVSIEVICKADLTGNVHASLLQQAVSNLIDNALKYSEPSQSVVVIVSCDDFGLLIQVKDSGTGIAKSHLPRLFERFYRVDTARSRELGGTGLGLAIVKHIADLHGGRVDVQSEYGKGSTFSIHLPAH